jgi:hypothetical protein
MFSRAKKNSNWSSSSVYRERMRQRKEEKNTTRKERERE